MKNKLFFLILAMVANISVMYAKTDYAALGIERKVLFTMNKNEICTYVDTRNLQKGVNYILSEIFVIDTVKNITTYVMNGERICTGICTDYNQYGDWGIDPAYKGAEEMPSKDSIVIVYRQSDGNYIRYGMEVYGPYSYVSSVGWNKFVFSYDYGTPDGYSNYSLYIHDSDGMIFPAKGQGRTFFQSPNKKHSAMVSADNIYKIRIDNVMFTLDSIMDSYDKRKTALVATVDISMFNDGSCLVEYLIPIQVADWGKGLDWDDYRGKRYNYPIEYYSDGGYYIKDGKVHLLSDNEYFDKKELKIKEKAKDEDVDDTYAYFKIKNDDEWKRDKYGRIDTKYYAKVWSDLTSQCRYGYNCWDKKHKSNLFTVPGLGYILVDGKAIKADYPLFAIYNPYVNAFRWAVVEGSDVVYYSYQLP